MLSRYIESMQNINAERFATKYVVDPATGCWNWTGQLMKNGYGRFAVGLKMQLAHRVSYTIHRGAIPARLLVCHHCDNKRCVNPEHFFLGTHKDNLQDASRKGRLPKTHGGNATWRRGKTKYDRIIGGVGRLESTCSECGAQVFYRPEKRRNLTGTHFCNQSCFARYFNKRRARAS